MLLCTPSTILPGRRRQPCRGEITGDYGRETCADAATARLRPAATGVAVRARQQDPRSSLTSADSRSIAASAVRLPLVCVNETGRRGGPVPRAAPILTRVRVRSSFCSGRPRGAQVILAFCARWPRGAQVILAFCARWPRGTQGCPTFCARWLRRARVILASCARWPRGARGCLVFCGRRPEGARELLPLGDRRTREVPGGWPSCDRGGLRPRRQPALGGRPDLPDRLPTGNRFGLIGGRRKSRRGGGVKVLLGNQARCSTRRIRQASA
jgi:hypothetical protein